MTKVYCKVCGKEVDETEQVSGFCFSCYDETALKSEVAISEGVREGYNKFRKKLSDLENMSPGENKWFWSVW